MADRDARPDAGDRAPGASAAMPGRAYTIAVWSARGGSGKTFLASSIALAGLARTGRRVLLVDLGLDFGGAEVFLDLHPERGVADLLPVLAELEPSQFERALTVHPSGLRVLCAGDRTGPAPSAAQVYALLRFCRAHHDLVLLDVPSALGEVTWAALTEATAILYVLTPDLPGVEGLRRTVARIEAERPLLLHRMGLAVNRSARGNPFGLGDIERLTGLPVLGQVRAAFWELQGYLARSRLPLHPGTRLTPLLQDVVRLATRLVG